MLHVGHGILEISFSLMVGHLQDKEMLVFHCFSKERWGRRAPWLLCHCPIMAVSMYYCWAPPSMDATFLAGWYFFIVALGMWSWEQILIATQAGTVECCKLLSRPPSLVVSRPVLTAPLWLQIRSRRSVSKWRHSRRSLVRSVCRWRSG